MIDVAPHPHLHLVAFTTTFRSALGDLPTPATILDMLATGAPAPLAAGDGVRAATRDLLRHGGFKPTGRSKPASEYLMRAASDGSLRPINAAVDAGNAVALHSGIPVSVVDLDRLAAPLSVAIALPGAAFVFNPAGQSIDVSGLLCLHDAEGPCANAVKDAQRTKTGPDTRRTLSLLWGTKAHAAHTDRASAWYRELLAPLSEAP